jgi:hypothetical protein
MYLEFVGGGARRGGRNTGSERHHQDPLLTRDWRFADRGSRPRPSPGLLRILPRLCPQVRHGGKSRCTAQHRCRPLACRAVGTPRLALTHDVGHPPFSHSPKPFRIINPRVSQGPIAVQRCKLLISRDFFSIGHPGAGIGRRSCSGMTLAGKKMAGLVRVTSRLPVRTACRDGLSVALLMHEIRSLSNILSVGAQTWRGADRRATDVVDQQGFRLHGSFQCRKYLRKNSALIF